MTPQPDRTHLYGFDGDEYMDFDPSETLQRWIESNVDDDTADPPPIEEWSVLPKRRHFPTAERHVEQIVENVVEGYYIDTVSEELGDQLLACELDKDPEILALAEALLVAMSERITWRMADRCLRKITASRSEDGTWLLGGEPAWVPAGSSGETP